MENVEKDDNATDREGGVLFVPFCVFVLCLFVMQ